MNEEDRGSTLAAGDNAFLRRRRCLYAIYPAAAGSAIHALRTLIGQSGRAVALGVPEKRHGIDIEPFRETEYYAESRRSQSPFGLIQHPSDGWSRREPCAASTTPRSRSHRVRRCAAADDAHGYQRTEAGLLYVVG
jgi:hypothetical protein